MEYNRSIVLRVNILFHTQENTTPLLGRPAPTDTYIWLFLRRARSEPRPITARTPIPIRKYDEVALSFAGAEVGGGVSVSDPAGTEVVVTAAGTGFAVPLGFIPCGVGGGGVRVSAANASGADSSIADAARERTTFCARDVIENRFIIF